MNSMNQKINNRSCLSCGTKIDGNYCPHCGVKIINSQDYSLKHFIQHAFGVITNFDNHFLKSFYLLLVKPGFLTKEYLIGRRKLYLKPVQMFLIANFIYFFFQPITQVNGFITPLHSQLNRLPYSSFVNKIVDKKLETSGVSYQDYEAAFNSKTRVFAKTLIIIMIPLFAAFLHLLFFSTKKYFVEHLIYGFHFYAFFLLYIFILLYLMARPVFNLAVAVGIPLYSVSNFEFFATVLILIVFLIYFSYPLKDFIRAKKSYLF